MDTSDELNPVSVAFPTTPLETLLSESRQLQALSRQLIKESREQRAICQLLLYTYCIKHQLERYPDIYARMLPGHASLVARGRLNQNVDPSPT